MKENFTSIPSRSRPRLFLDVALRLQLDHLALEPRDLELLRLHLTVPGKRLLRIVGELLHPIAQLRHMHVQVLRCLNIRYAPILDQAHRLKLELPGKLTPLHDAPPAPSKHLTQCLRNRVQANPTYRRWQGFELSDANDHQLYIPKGFAHGF